jgi:predicted small secreted protein
MRSTVSKVIAGTFLFASVGFLGGCNTVKGMGEDVYALGDTSQRALNEAWYGDAYGPQDRASFNRTYYGD